MVFKARVTRTPAHTTYTVFSAPGDDPKYTGTWANCGKLTVANHQADELRIAMAGVWFEEP